MSIWLEMYIVSACIIFGTGAFVTALSALSLSIAKDRLTTSTGFAREYVKNTWIPKSRDEVKSGLLLMASSVIAPVVIVVMVGWVFYEIGAGIYSAFKE